jgi:acetyl esterase/lipase
MKQITCLLLATMALCASANAGDVEILKDLEYAKRGEQSLKLDLHLPSPRSNPSLPIVVWVHGGGWLKGSKERCPGVWLAETGDYAVASINYRLASQAQWPAQMEDCREAVRWLRRHADDYGLDGDHVGVWGGSAGGHLVALMGTLDVPTDENVSSRIQAVCDWYGPSDLLTMPPNVISAKRTREQVKKSNGAVLLGDAIVDIPERAKSASAFHQVSADDAPFLIMHGDADPGVPLEQSTKLHEKLQAAGVSSTLEVLAGAGHGGKEFRTPDAQSVIKAFFDRHLRKR